MFIVIVYFIFMVLDMFFLFHVFVIVKHQNTEANVWYMKSYLGINLFVILISDSFKVEVGNFYKTNF